MPREMTIVCDFCGARELYELGPPNSRQVQLFFGMHTVAVEICVQCFDEIAAQLKTKHVSAATAKQIEVLRSESREPKYGPIGASK